MSAIEVPAWWDVDPLDLDISVIATEPALIYDEIAASYPSELTCAPADTTT